MKDIRVGFAMCGSFCTHRQVLSELEKLCGTYTSVIPILSENCCRTDTRFGTAADLAAEVKRLTGKAPMDSVAAAEPIGPRKLLDVLVIAPCTGNTLAKLANGITDTAVMATNDGLSAAARNIGELLTRKNYYFVPFGQDDPEKKPCSLMADFSRIGETVDAALEGRQIQPILL